MSLNGKYQVGELVFCYQGLLIYEAKIQGIKPEGTSFLYDVHYRGWNKTWDEWVVEDRLLKINEVNRHKKKEVESAMKARKNFAAKKTSGNAIKRSTSESTEEQVEGTGSSREVSKDRDVTKPIMPRVKKLRSRSNSDASIISVTSTKSVDSKKSVDTSKSKRKPPSKRKAAMKDPIQDLDDEEINAEEIPSRPKTRPVKPLVGKKSVTEVPKSHKKSKKSKTKEPSPAKASTSKIPPKKSKKASKPKIKKSSSPPIENPKSVNRRKFGEEIVIPLSDELKAVLVDDFDYIGRQRKLLNVPSRYTVDDLINAYYQARKEVEGETEEQLLGAEEVCRGLKDYFNSTLGSQLLYKFERVQYSDTLKENTGVPMAQLYGPVHLLRLLTKLGPMLSAADIEQEAMDNLLVHVTDFISYMHKHRETLYQIDDYGTATPEYHRRAL